MSWSRLSVSGSGNLCSALPVSAVWTMKPLSADLRERILASDREGLSTGETAKRLSVGVSTVKRLRAQHAELGHLEVRPRPAKPLRLEPYRADLERWIAEEPGLTLEELAARVKSTHRVRVGLSTVHKSLGRFGLTRKKRR
jgi:transposase